jgi:uncharacterized protein GlcG (DUF336 family)
VKIPLPLSRLLGSIAERTAAERELAMAIAIVDEEGLLQYFARMEGTLPASTDIAISKAYTAAALRMSTREVGQLALPGNPLYGIENTNAGKIVLFGGGVPLLLQKRVVGGLGISGGSVEEDEEVAEAVLETLASMEGLAAWVKPLLPGRRPGTNWMFQVESSLEEALAGGGYGGARKLAPFLAGALMIAFAQY